MLELRDDELAPDYYIAEPMAPMNKNCKSTGRTAAAFVSDKKKKARVQLHGHDENFGISIPQKRLFMCFVVQSL